MSIIFNIKHIIFAWVSAVVVVVVPRPSPLHHRVILVVGAVAVAVAVVVIDTTLFCCNSIASIGCCCCCQLCTYSVIWSISFVIQSNINFWPILLMILIWFLDNSIEHTCPDIAIVTTFWKKHAFKKARGRGMFYGVNKPEISQPKIKISEWRYIFLFTNILI